MRELLTPNVGRRELGHSSGVGSILISEKRRSHSMTGTPARSAASSSRSTCGKPVESSCSSFVSVAASPVEDASAQLGEAGAAASFPCARAGRQPFIARVPAVRQEQGRGPADTPATRARDDLPKAAGIARSVARASIASSRLPSSVLSRRSGYPPKRARTTGRRRRSRPRRWCRRASGRPRSGRAGGRCR